MVIKGKGKYIGKRKFEIEQEPNLPIDAEIFFTIEEIKPVEQIIKKNKETKKEENPWDEILKLAKPAGRSDLSVRHHEILGDLIE